MLAWEWSPAVEQVIAIERTRDACARAEQHSGQLIQRLSGRSRDQHDRDTELGLQAMTELVTRESGQKDVDQSEPWPKRPRKRERSLACRSLRNREAGTLEE